MCKRDVEVDNNYPMQQQQSHKYNHLARQRNNIQTNIHNSKGT
jgi:hypothetical protein